MDEKSGRSTVLPERISRRNALKLLFGSALAGLLGTGCGFDRKISIPTPEVTRTPPNLEIIVDVSQLEEVPIPELTHYPDTHTSVIPNPSNPNQAEVYFSAGTRGYRAEWDISKEGAIEQITDPVVITSPNYEQTSGYGRLRYSAISSVVAPTPNIRIGFVHQEFHGDNGSFPFHAQIAITISSDSGQTWSETQPIITAPFPDEEPTAVSGVGQPSAIIIGPYVYVYHTEWAASMHSIQIKRALIDQVDQPDAWESFESQLELEPGVVDGVHEAYKSLAGIQYVPDQDCYLLSFESSNGFYSCTSVYGITWTQPKQMLSFPTSHDQRKEGDVWYSYPTLVPTSEDGTSGILLCSQGTWMDEPHKMVKMPYTVQTA